MGVAPAVGDARALGRVVVRPVRVAGRGERQRLDHGAARQEIQDLPGDRPGVVGVTGEGLARP